MEQDHPLSRAVSAFGEEAVKGAAGLVLAGAASIALGPVPAVLLGAAGATALVELVKWRLARLQTHRVDVALAAGVVELECALGANRVPRPEIVEAIDARVPDLFANELIEAVLLTARDAYQEAKVEHLGRFWARYLFRSDISPDQARYLHRQAASLCYRQWLLLELAHRRGAVQWRNPPRDSRHGPRMGEAAALDTELDEMDRALLLQSESTGEELRYTILPSGLNLRDLLGLESIPDEALEATASTLLDLSS